MIDDGELDWKIIAINAEDPKAPSVNDIEDVERYGPPHLLCITASAVYLLCSCIVEQSTSFRFAN